MAQPALDANEIKNVQTLLDSKGCDVGEIDGQFGEKTAAAIRQYQSDWRLPETGEMSSELIERLTGEHPDTRPVVQDRE